MKGLTCIFIVFGKKANDDYSNIKTIDTKVIPLVGDMIRCFGKTRLVTSRLINYSHVDAYRGNCPDRGGELIYIFTEEV